MRALIAVALSVVLFAGFAFAGFAFSGFAAGQQVGGSAAGQRAGPIPNGRVKSGTLSFDGYASVGDFTGTTSTVSGEMTGGSDLSAVRGWIEAPVKALKTGNGKRDRDLNKSMESDKFPTMRFDLTGVTPSGGAGAADGAADSAAVTLHGAMTIHGVRRQVDLPATVVLRGDEARIRSDFPLNVKDYEVGGLSKALGILRMNERITVHIDLRFQLQSPISGAQ